LDATLALLEEFLSGSCSSAAEMETRIAKLLEGNSGPPGFAIAVDKLLNDAELRRPGFAALVRNVDSKSNLSADRIASMKTEADRACMADRLSGMGLSM